MATLSLISFCLVLLLGSPAVGQAANRDRLAPQDTLEISASGWDALLGGLPDTAIEAMGMSDLPRIGRLLGTGQVELAAMKAQLKPEADTTAPDGEVAEVWIDEAFALTPRERARSAAPAEILLAASQEADAPKSGMQLAGGKLEEILRRALAAARRDLEAMRSVAEKQRQRADALARDLTMMLQVVEEVEAKAAGAMRAKAAALRARDAAEAALADERRALDEVRRKQATYEVRQSTAAPRTDVSLTVAGKAADVEARQIAEAAARRAVEELALERGKARSLARELDSVRRERDATKRWATQDGRDLAVARQIAEAAARRAVEELAAERERAALLARELDSARRERDAANRWAIQDGRDLVVARQLTAVPQPDANLVAAEKAAVMLARQIAEAAASRAVEQLALEREKAASLARELDAALQERDAAKKQLTRISAAQQRASEEPRERADGRAPAATRKEIAPRKTRTERREAGMERAPKPLPDELLPRRLLPGLW